MGLVDTYLHTKPKSRDSLVKGGSAASYGTPRHDPPTAPSAYSAAVDSARSTYQKRMTKYERRMEAVKNTQAAIKKLEKGAAKRRKRAELERRLAKAKKPKKPLILKVDKAASTAGNALARADYILGFTNPSKKNIIGQFIRHQEKERNVKRYGSPSGKSKVQRALKEYKGAESSAEVRYLASRGLGPDRKTIRQTIRFQEARRIENRKNTKTFTRTRRKNRARYNQILPKQFKEDREALVARLNREDRERLNRTLEPQEIRENERFASLVQDDRGVSKRLTKQLGAPLEAPKKLVKQAKRALDSTKTGKETRKLAHNVLQGQYDLDSPYRGQIITGKDKKGRPSAALISGERLTHMRKREREAAAEKEDEETPDNLGEWFTKAATDAGRAVGTLPQSFEQQAQAAWEILRESQPDAPPEESEEYQHHPVKAVEDYLNRKIEDPDDEEFLPKTKAMLKEMSEVSPIYGVAKTLVEGGSVKDALEEGFNRVNKNPLTILELVPATSAARFAVGAVRHGGVGKARAVRTARPSTTVDNRLRQSRFEDLSPKARRAQLKAKRQQAKHEAKGRNRGEEVPREPDARVQTYSPVASVRMVQKGRETVRTLKGQDPYNIAGKRAVARDAKRNARMAVRKSRIANLAIGADAVEDLDRATDGMINKRDRQEQAAFELAYDGSIRDGAMSTGADLKAVEAHYRKGDTALDEQNANMVQKLREDYEKYGDDSIMQRVLSSEHLKDARRIGLDMDEMLVRTHHITQKTAEARRGVQQAQRRIDDFARVEKGKALHGQEGRKNKVYGEQAEDEVVVTAARQAQKDEAEAFETKAEAETKAKQAQSDAAEAEGLWRRTLRAKGAEHQDTWDAEAAAIDARQEAHARTEHAKDPSGVFSKRNPGDEILKEQRLQERLGKKHAAASGRRKKGPIMAQIKNSKKREAAFRRMVEKIDKETPGVREAKQTVRKAVKTTGTLRGHANAVKELEQAFGQLGQAMKERNPAARTKAKAQALARVKAARELIEAESKRAIDAGEPSLAINTLAKVEASMVQLDAQIKSAKKSAMGEDSPEMTDPKIPQYEAPGDPQSVGPWNKVQALLREKAELKASAKRLRQHIKREAKAGLQLAESDGYAYIDWHNRGHRGIMVNPKDLKGPGRYVSPTAANYSHRGKKQELAREAAGEYRTSEIMRAGALGDENVKATLIQRARLIGMIRLKNMLIQQSPYKRSMDQEEANLLIASLNKQGEGRYVAVPSGRYKGSVDVEDMTPGEFAGEFTRPPKAGEKVYVVPELTKRVFDQTTKQRGFLTTGSNYIGQRFVSAILPYSVQWQVGNIIDLTTRLLLSGVNPLGDHLLWKHIETEVNRVLPPEQALEWLAHIKGHFGSRQADVRGADLTKVAAAIPGDFGDALADVIGNVKTNPVTKFGVGGPGRLTQLLFDAASKAESPLSGMAGGKAIRMQARDLGIDMKDHAELAQRMVREWQQHPELVDDFARRTTEIVGDYSGSAFQRTVVAGVDPFWTWLREANKFVLYTMPVKHPVISSLALMASAMGPEIAKRLGLEEIYNQTGFLAGAFPGGMEGWYRPMAPMTSLGETMKMLEDPVSYLASRPFPYLNKALGNAAGYQFDTAGEILVREGQELTGIELPEFEEPGREPSFPGDPAGMFQGDKSDLAFGTLIQSFVPGAHIAQQVREKGFPSDTSTFFHPSAKEGSEVPVWEQSWLNPFGRRRDLDDLAEDEEKPGKPGEDGAQKAGKNMRLEVGTERYRSSDGARMVWNGEHWVEREGRRSAQNAGRGADVSNPSKVERNRAVQKLAQQFPQLAELDIGAIGAIAQASRKYDIPPEILSAVYGIETNYGTSNLPGVSSGENSSGAGGPMQFLAATWEAYGVDGDGDGVKDRYNPVDAIYGAANLLKSNGGDTDIEGALLHYNNAGWYVDDVVTRAKEFESPLWKAAGTGAGMTSNVPVGPKWSRMKKAVTGASRGEVQHLSPELRDLLLRTAQRSGAPVTVRSGYRSKAEQQELYDLYLSGQGNLAAPPGSSNHEIGQAVDVSLTSEQRAIAVELGATFPVSTESWHMEVGSDEAWNAKTGAGAASVQASPPVYRSPGKVRKNLIGLPGQGTHTLGNWQSDNAIDIAIPTGSKVRAVTDGVIGGVKGDNADPSSQFNGFQVYLGDDIWYTHLSDVKVKEGDRVQAGDVIGLSGAANNVDHLHFSVNPSLGDPRDYIGGSVPAASGGGSYPSLASSGVSGAPAVGGTAVIPGMDTDSERAGLRRRRVQQMRIEGMELALALLNDEIDVVEFVSGLRSSSARLGTL